MRFALGYMKPYKWMVVFAITLKVAAMFAELLIPYVLEYMIDDIVPRKDLKAVFLGGAVMVVLILVLVFANIISNVFAARSAKSAAFALRKDLFCKSLELSGWTFDRFGLPSITSRMTSDSYNVQDFMRMFQSFGIRAPLLLVGGIVVSLHMDIGLGLILLIIGPLTLAILVIVSFKGIPLYDKVQRSIDEITLVMRENITGIRVVKALSKEEHEKKRFAGCNDTMRKRDLSAGTVMALPSPVMTLFLNVGLVLCVLVGAGRVDAGLTEPGVILAFLTYFNLILMGAMGLSRVLLMMSKCTASAERIREVTEAPEELLPVSEEDAAKPRSGAYIIFDHVSFSYGDGGSSAESPAGGVSGPSAADSSSAAPSSAAPAGGVSGSSAAGPSAASTAAIPAGNAAASCRDDSLSGGERQKALLDICFEMEEGSSLGIIGPTGCGKTTLINLLMRFYDADEGHIFVAGKDVRSYNLAELRRMFGTVFQNDMIFADTIEENIKFGRDISDDQMRRAAKDAFADGFISACDGGYSHECASGGADFSGGQKQRIMIARALAQESSILILDDSSSALDYKTDAMLRQAIRENHRCTSIIVAQRVSSVMSLERIIVMNEGRIIGIGSHEYLMETCEEYKDIYKVQMGGESA